jgi:hypothetical protein
MKISIDISERELLRRLREQLERKPKLTRHRLITEGTLRALRPAPRGKRLEIFDTIVPCFGIRSTENHVHSYIVYTRFERNGPRVRRTIARVGDIPLSEARATAMQWAEAAAEARKRNFKLRLVG